MVCSYHLNPEVLSNHYIYKKTPFDFYPLILHGEIIPIVVQGKNLGIIFNSTLSESLNLQQPRQRALHPRDELDYLKVLVTGILPRNH